MGQNGGIWVYSTFCSPHAGPCTSVCHSCQPAASVFKAAYQNYKDCHGNHLYIPGTSATELSLGGYCPVVSLNSCNDVQGTAVVSIVSTGPAVGNTSNSGCTHGHARYNHKLGCLNRSAMVYLKNGSANKMWAYNYATD
jgi:hypothetical protein